MFLGFEGFRAFGFRTYDGSNAARMLPARRESPLWCQHVLRAHFQRFRKLAGSEVAQLGSSHLQAQGFLNPLPKRDPAEGSMPHAH